MSYAVEYHEVADVPEMSGWYVVGEGEAAGPFDTEGEAHESLLDYMESGEFDPAEMRDVFPEYPAADDFIGACLEGVDPAEQGPTDASPPGEFLGFGVAMSPTEPERGYFLVAVDGSRRITATWGPYPNMDVARSAMRKAQDRN